MINYSLLLFSALSEGHQDLVFDCINKGCRLFSWMKIHIISVILGVTFNLDGFQGETKWFPFLGNCMILVTPYTFIVCFCSLPSLSRCFVGPTIAFGWTVKQILGFSAGIEDFVGEKPESQRLNEYLSFFVCYPTMQWPHSLVQKIKSTKHLQCHIFAVHSKITRCCCSYCTSLWCWCADQVNIF